MKGKGGAIGITENPIAMQRRLICGLKIANCEFESVNKKTTSSTLQGFATQTKMKQQVKSSLIDVICAM